MLIFHSLPSFTVFIMQKLNNSLTFVTCNLSTTDSSLLDKLAELTYEYWQEIDWPHPPKPVELIKLTLMAKFRVDQDVVHTLMLNEDGKAIGFSTSHINTSGNNKFLAGIEPFIKHEYRRKNLLASLLSESIKNIPDYVTTLRFFFRVDDTQRYPNEMKSFDLKINELTQELSLKHASTVRRSDAELSKMNLDKISEQAKILAHKAEKNGYTIHFVDNIEFKGLPFTRKQYVRLLEELDNDMPREESSQQDNQFSEFDFLNWFKYAKEEKLTEWLFIASNKNGEPIGMTETKIRGDIPELAYVGDTGVQRDHRGKRLGLTLKTLMLEKLLTDPISKNKVKYWITYNAFSNNYMISINDQLGYKQTSLEHSYEISKDKLVDYVNSRLSSQ